MSLKVISSPIKANLEEFDIFFKDLMKTDVPLLDIVLRYMTKKKGKRIRPILVFLSAQLAGEINHRTYVGASMVELLHTATLVHDDVVDKAKVRRGLVSINAKWNNKIAVLVGDYLLSKGLMVAMDNNEPYFLNETSKTVKRLSEGELLAIERVKKTKIDEETYYKIISDKTAALISTCTKIGAMSATDDEEYQQRMEEFGEYLGMAFQLKDDLFDYLASESFIGKPVGNDIKEKKITLPLIYSFEKSEKSEAKKIKKMIKKGNLSKKDIKYIVNYAKVNGGVDYTYQKAEEYKAKALNLLDFFPDGEAKTALTELSDFVVTREF